MRSQSSCGKCRACSSPPPKCRFGSFIVVLGRSSCRFADVDRASSAQEREQSTHRSNAEKWALISSHRVRHRAGNHSYNCARLSHLARCKEVAAASLLRVAACKKVRRAPHLIRHSKRSGVRTRRCVGEARDEVVYRVPQLSNHLPLQVGRSTWSMHWARDTIMTACSRAKDA